MIGNKQKRREETKEEVIEIEEEEIEKKRRKEEDEFEERYEELVAVLTETKVRKTRRKKVEKGEKGGLKKVTPKRYAKLLKTLKNEYPLLLKDFLEEVHIVNAKNERNFKNPETGSIVRFGQKQTYENLDAGFFDSLKLACSCGSSFCRCQFGDIKQHFSSSCHGNLGHAFKKYYGGDKSATSGSGKQSKIFSFFDKKKVEINIGTFEMLKDDLIAARTKFLQVFALVQNHVALSNLPNFTQLLTSCGCPTIVECFESRDGIDDILEAIAQAIQKKVCDEIFESAGGFSIAFDDSKDVSGWEEMIVSCNFLFLNPKRTVVEVRSRFLSLRHVPKPTGENLANELINVLKGFGEQKLKSSSVEFLGKDLALKKLLNEHVTMFDADGAAANQSDNIGAKGYLAEFFPKKPFNWCGGHKSGLVIKFLKNSFSGFNLVEELAVDIGVFFSYEQRWSAFLGFCEFFNLEKPNMFPKICRTRLKFHYYLLSHFCSVFERVLLFFHFCLEPSFSSSWKDGINFTTSSVREIRDLFLKMLDYFTICCVHIVADSLTQIVALTLEMEKVQKNHDQIVKCFDSIYGEIELLEKAKFSSGGLNWKGGEISAFLKKTPYDAHKTIKLRHLEEDEISYVIPYSFPAGKTFNDIPSMIVNFCQKLGASLKEGMNKYFDGDLPIYQALSLIGTNFLLKVKNQKDEKKVSEMGKKKLQNLCKFLFVDYSEVADEFLGFKNALRKMNDLDLSDPYVACAQVCLYCKSKKMKLTVLENLLFKGMCSLMDSMSCERYFSSMKLYKSSLQASMKPKKLCNILSVAINLRGMTVDEFSVSDYFLDAFDIWLNKSERMIVGMADECVNLQKDHEDRLNVFLTHLQNTHTFQISKKK